MADKHPAEILVQEAYKHVGSGGHSWVCHTAGIPSNLAWCAATQCAIAIACKYSGKICPTAVWAAGGFGHSVCTDYRGIYISGPKNGGKNVYPQVGDYILFIYGSATSYSGTKYGASHIGLVAGVSKTQITTIEGNSSHTYKVNHYSINYKSIAYYARPRWSILGASMIVPNNTVNPSGGDYEDGGGGLGEYIPIFSTRSTRADALLREVSYWNEKSSKPTSTKTNTALSLINYTNLLSDFSKLFMLNTTGTAGANSTADNIDALSGTEKIIVQYLINKGLNTAQAIGILANIHHESGCKTDAVNRSSGASGICQWLGTRKTNMIRMVGSNWKNTLSGQLDFLWSELTTSYKSSTYNKIIKQPNTSAGASNSAEIFVRNFERPGSIEQETLKRRNTASSYWNKVVTESTSSTSSETASGSIKTQSGRKITKGTSISIPSSVNQNGMTASYTPYIRNWSSGTTQRKIYDVWRKNGQPTIQKGMVNVGGYCCIALTPTFGKVGDIVSIVFTDNTYLNCLIADAKNPGDSNYTRWGHKLGKGGVDVVEWESTYSGTTSGHNGVLADLKAMKIRGKKVKKIVNYGTWFR